MCGCGLDYLAQDRVHWQFLVSRGRKDWSNEFRKPKDSKLKKGKCGNWSVKVSWL
jgi:hypothetical protein